MVAMYKYIILLLLIFTSCERELEDQVCCDWDAANFDPDYNGHNVNQLYFTNSSLCNDNVCIYENY